MAQAVESLRLSNHRNYFPRALLARAALSRLHGQFALAHQDVEEALAIAQSSAMDFYQADAYLEQASLHLAASGLSSSETHVDQAAIRLGKAKVLIDAMGYYRRRRQVVELEALLRRVAAPCG